ncbi:hypothetical protein [Pseudonocardia alaniniphila]|uniref:Uncharacterized protein n=1 Tax=Pseudonocardia alaniniphila TaxID=75291 RepID=A0ABS9TNJ8_9PSEU|nr:hypothetical protein [Pseudonocardia alaniniphila]MCH6169851.1 hypothetical protein [Pseudonocardia alaniniphila]
MTAPLQDGLWGEPTATPTPTTQRSEINDVELVASVIRAALSRGYVLIGPADRVYLRDAAPAGKAHAVVVEPVPAYEQDTVRQLLDSGHLSTGGIHHVRYGRNDGPTHSVLVPKATRAMVNRWAALRPLTSRPTTSAPAPAPHKLTERKPAGAGSRRGKRPSCGRLLVDVVRPGLGLVTCGGGDFSGSIVRQDGHYLVETEHGQVIGRAASYRAGAHLLARHHGYDPGPVEIEHEKDLA